MNSPSRREFSAFIPLALTIVLLSGNIWAQGKFVYTNDDQSTNTVSGFSVASDGTLTAIPGSPFATGDFGLGTSILGSNRIAVAGNFLFAANTRFFSVSVFTINPSTGVLTPVPGSPFGTGGTQGFISDIALSPTPDGRFLMVSIADSFSSFSIAVFSIASNGALTPIAGSPFPAIYIPLGLKVSPDGRFLAVTLYSNQIQMFSIGSDGSLTSVDVFTAQGIASSVFGVDIDCSASFLYAGELGATVVDALNIASNGTLSPIAGSPFQAGVGAGSGVALLSPDDRTLFVSNQGNVFVSNSGGNTITVFSVASGGSLSLLAGSPFPMSGLVSLPLGMSISQDGTLLYVADRNDLVNSMATVSVFRVATDGSLTEVAGSPFATGQPRGASSLTAYPTKSCVLPVRIEIKPPASPPVPINPAAKGKIPVAILSTLTFNAVTQINTNSLTFGHTGNEASLASCATGGQDVNGDGLNDLMCRFNTPRTGFVAGDTTAFLKGQTVAGTKIQGSEAIRTVPK